MFVSLQFKLELKKEDREKLIKLMRKQSSAIRVAYNMIRELEKEKTKNPHAQIYHRLRQLFPPRLREFMSAEALRYAQYMDLTETYLDYITKLLGRTGVKV